MNPTRRYINGLKKIAKMIPDSQQYKDQFRRLKIWRQEFEKDGRGIEIEEEDEKFTG